MTAAIMNLEQWLDLTGNEVSGDELMPPIEMGQLWQRVEESGRPLEVCGTVLLWTEPNCGNCAPPYGCPPGSHSEPVRDLTNIIAAREPTA